MEAEKGGISSGSQLSLLRSFLNICDCRQCFFTQWGTFIIYFGLGNEQNLARIIIVDILIHFPDEGTGRPSGEVTVLNPHSRYLRVVCRMEGCSCLSFYENRAFFRTYSDTLLSSPIEHPLVLLPDSQFFPCSVGNENLTHLEKYTHFSFCIFLLCVVGQYDFEMLSFH